MFWMHFINLRKENRKKEAEELIREEQLNEEAAKRYILTSLKKEYASGKWYRPE